MGVNQAIILNYFCYSWLLLDYDFFGVDIRFLRDSEDSILSRFQIIQGVHYSYDLFLLQLMYLRSSPYNLNQRIQFILQTFKTTKSIKINLSVFKLKIYRINMSVKVGVRVRPFNQREKDLNCKLCVQMMGQTTRLFNPDHCQQFRDFTFDYSFWSHDGFHPNEKGYFVPDSDKYADQRLVFQKVGQQILTNAWEGYHCCLFAYGQTGSGKSYSMIGYGPNQGIVPISCSEIFNRIAQNQNKNKEYEVHFSMLEIYNQKVQDLFIPINKRSKDGYKIRQSPTLGIYVEGLTKHYVDTYSAIEKKMEEGGKNRSIAATDMNDSSSRAHTIISIEFRQKEVIEGKKRQKLSVIHLVDLAGSEKVGKTGAQGDRFNEAKGINQSLSTLGRVIEKLALQEKVIPYRESCLTRILQNALGGNSKTLMICAISPANDNYEQTISTLRYADQAKKIKNKAVVNQSQTDKIIRNLTAQKEQLKEKVAKMQQMFRKLSMGLGIDAQKIEELKDVQEQLKFNSKLVDDYSLTKQEKKQNQDNWNHQFSVDKVDETKPHLSNLNQDFMLSQKIKYAINQETLKIGKRNLEPANDIELGGMGIRNLHAQIVTKDQKLYIQPELCGQSQDTAVYLNGDNVIKRRELMNYDRLTIGTNNIFLVLIPDTPIRDDIDTKSIDWDFAQNQLYLQKESERQQMEEKQRKIKEQTEAILLQRQKELYELQKKLQQNLEQQQEMEKVEEERRVKEKETEQLRKKIENDKKKIQERQILQKSRIKEKYYLEKKLLKALPQCIELNLIAKEFKRNISISVKMILSDQRQDQQYQDDLDIKKKSIKVKVINRQAGYIYWWDIDRLQNRYYLIKDMSEAYFETGNIPQLTQEADPFWDPPEHVLIGRAFITTKALSYMFDNETSLSIIGEDEHCGEITVNMIPTDESGQRNLSEQMEQEQIEFEPQDLLGKPFYYNILIDSAIIPDNLSNVYVQYSVRLNENKQAEVFKTQEVKQKTCHPHFNYKKLHCFEKVTENLLEYLQTAKIIFKVYAHQLLPKQIKQDSNPTPKLQIKPATNFAITTSTAAIPAIKLGKIESAGISPNKSHQKIATSAQSLVLKKKSMDKEGCQIF